MSASYLSFVKQQNLKISFPEKNGGRRAGAGFKSQQAHYLSIIIFVGTLNLYYVLRRKHVVRGRRAMSRTAGGQQEARMKKRREGEARMKELWEGRRVSNRGLVEEKTRENVGSRERTSIIS